MCKATVQNHKIWKFFYERIGIELAIWFEGGSIDWNEYWDFLVDGWATKSLLVRLVSCFFRNQSKSLM